MVTTLADTETQGYTNLRDALAEAASMGGNQTIAFASGLTGTISLYSSLVIFSNVTIEGPGASVLTVSGGGLFSNFSVITVENGVTASLSGLTIADGYTASNGGGILNEGKLRLTDATVTGNSAAGGGGGIGNYGTAMLYDSTLSGNTASDGGGMVNNDMATLVDVTIAGNVATYGGGIGNHTTMTLDDDTIAANSAGAGNGGGIANGGSATLDNTIVADNVGGDIVFAGVSGADDLIGDASSPGGLTNGVNGNVVGVSPLLSPLGSYGGPTPTMALLPGSPAIDAGSNILIPAGTTTDQRGFARIINGTVDIGAFESSGFTLTLVNGDDQSASVGSVFAESLEVSVTADNAAEPVDGGMVTFAAPSSGASATLNPSGPVTIVAGAAKVTATANETAGGPYTITASAAGASPAAISLSNGQSSTPPSGIVVTTLSDAESPGETTLRDALAEAESLGGDQTITFAPGLTGTIFLDSGLVIGSDVDIEGPGASSLTISGGGSNSSFSVITVSSGVTASLSGLTIADGFTESDGGGILNKGTLTLTDAVVTGNAASGGGGIANYGTATLYESTIYGNNAAHGGGLYNDGTATLTDVTIASNGATFGGGILSESSLTLDNDTLAFNAAGNGGGGIAVFAGSATLNNTIVARSNGGDIGFGLVGGSNNLIDDPVNAGGLVDGVDGNLVGVYPMLAPLGNYGGPTPTIALLPGSPAIDAGNNALVPAGVTTDQRGNGFPRIVGGTVDIGSFEVNTTTAITSSAVNNTSAYGQDVTFTATVTPAVAGTPTGTVQFYLDGEPAGGPVVLVGGQAVFDAGSALNPGTYQVTAVYNTGGNFDSSGSVPLSYVITTPLAITSFGPVLPNPRNSPVKTVDVTFSEPIDPSSFTTAALTLTDGGPNLITSAVTISLDSGSTYTIGGLAGLTASDGFYVLTVNAADIQDLDGNPGLGSLATSWLMDRTPPTSHVNPLAARGTSLSFPVSVAGSDPVAADGGPASGVATYTIYDSTDGGPWSVWTTVPASSPTATFIGQSNTSYSFYSIATDLAGNIENKSPRIEASTYLPDLTPPVTAVNATTGTNPSTVNNTTGTFILDLTGNDPGGAALTYFEVFVSVDGGTYQEVGPYAIPAGFADSHGNYHSSIAYQGLTDGQSHNYAFYSIGLDAAGNLQMAPTGPNVTFANQVFSLAQPGQLQVSSFTVEHGSPSRSFIRYLDLGFNESDAQGDGELTTIVNSVGTASPDITIYKYDLNGDASSKTPVALSSPTMLSVIDHAIEINFGAGGIGNSPTSTAADGYYEVDIKLPSGQVAVHHFYRLLGDVAGDGIVDQNDLNEIAASIGESSATGWAPFERRRDGRRHGDVAGPPAGDAVEEPEAGNRLGPGMR